MNTGKALEALVRHSADRQAKLGINLKQTSPRFVGGIGPDGQAQGRVVGKGTLDFVGDLLGRSVQFDAKSTKARSSFKLSLIKRHQATIVRNAHERGAIAFFLIEFSTLEGGPRYYALTWPVLQPFWDKADFGGVQSIPREIIQRGCVEIPRKGKTLDLVGAIRRLQEVAA